MHIEDFGAPHAASSPAGNALVFAAIVCEALFILLNRRLRTPVAVLLATFGQMRTTRSAA